MDAKGPRHRTQSKVIPNDPDTGGPFCAKKLVIGPTADRNSIKRTGCIGKRRQHENRHDFATPFLSMPRQITWRLFRENRSLVNCVQAALSLSKGERENPVTPSMMARMRGLFRGLAASTSFAAPPRGICPCGRHLKNKTPWQ